MDSSDAPYVLKETRLNLEPPASAFVVNIKVPSTSASNRYQRQSVQKPADEDETAFRLKNLATASSIYRRQWHDTPRSFLWRVLDDGSVLSIRVVDVSRTKDAPESSLILNFRFPAPIQPGCVALADPQEHDALGVYVLDQVNQLYSFMLRPEFFRKKSSMDAVLTDFAKIYSPSWL
jgi:nuclear pore complex protein Nup160